MEQINRQNPTPLYEQLKLILRDQIMMGTLTPGTLLPSEQSYCEKFKISRITVSRALGDLEREGFVQRIQGKGTIVTYPAHNEPLTSIRGFTRTILEAGKKATSKVLSIDTLPGNIALANVFKLPQESENNFIRFRRLRYVDGVPATIMTSIVRESLGLRMQEFELENTSFYSLFEKILGVQVIRNETTLIPIIATPEVIELLNARPGSAHFLFRGVSYIEGDIPIELSLAVFHGGMFTFSTNIYNLSDHPTFQPELQSGDFSLVEFPTTGLD
jgi:DNA-binding GntR family transcriptional regulator